MDIIFQIMKKIIPKFLFRLLQPIYHYKLALFSAFLYRFPSRKLFVIGVTGTKGKSSTTEIISNILEEAHFKTAIVNTIRFKVGDESRKNMYKMSMPGRFFMQKFLRKAVNNKCTHAIIEITSEGAKQFRHKFIYLDVFVFTNISPEHIESHGSFEKYLDAKMSIAHDFEKSPKKNKVVIANSDDKYSNNFLNINIENKKTFSINDVVIKSVTPNISFSYKKNEFNSPLRGEFNIYNILAAINVAEYLGIGNETIQKGLSKTKNIPGRVEFVNAGQTFSVVVDYAHTVDSLEKFYKIFETKEKICVLGNTGGGRDTWKRPEMAEIAEKYCKKIILTNEDPYNENPQKILDDMIAGMKKRPEIIMDRREAIYKAITYANKNSAVLITGKGTDPYIMIEKGGKIPWSDRDVAYEEIKKFLSNKKHDIVQP